jgi:hypothetical protein
MLRPSIFDDLYEIGDPVANRPFRASVSCGIADAVAFSRAEASPANAVKAEWGMGSSVPSDVVWTLLGLPLIVSSRFVDLFETAQFTGWATYPVRLVAKDGAEIPGFHGLAISGRCDPPDLSRSEVVLRQYPGGLFPMFRGRFFDPASWDGTDVFMERPDDRGNKSVNRYVTGRVLRALRRSRISNLRLERLSQLEISAANYESGLRHRLPHDFDARVAALRAGK